MQKRIVTVRNRAGIHCRPSGVILTAIKNEFPDHFFQVITNDGEVTELDSMLALISLGLGKGTSVTLQVEGIDEERAIVRIGDLFEYEFDFPPKK
ncbi:MAG: HPr family phosphocarrier protein [Lentisphaerae bacterium]|nr:HPr family phosphocarrier protein [Lentisphaerota bacterium]